MKHDRGFSVLELLAGLAISMPLLAAFALALRGETETYRTVRKQDQSQAILLRTEALIQQGMLDSDSAPWAPLVRVHSPGKVSFADGSPNSAMTGSAARRPLRSSNALTSANLLSEHALAVRSAHLQGRVLIVKACTRLPNTLLVKPAQALLGVSNEGHFEVVANERAITATSGCRILRLRATKSMLTPTASLLDLRLIRIIVPLAQLRTLYVDREHQLRYLGHRGTENTENQPLLRGIKNLRLQSSSAPWNIPMLDVEITDLHEKLLKTTILASFARSAPYNFTLNRP